MEQTDILLEKVKEYRSWVEKAQAATTIADVDEAKVEGIKVLNRLTFQLNHAGKEIYNTTRVRRAEIVSAAQAKALVAAKAPEISTVVENPVEVASEPVAEPVEKPAKKKAKKSKK